MTYRILNPERASAAEVAPENIAENLKRAINLLKGNFYDLDTGRVSYHAMKGSMAFDEYTQLASTLRYFDLSQLQTPSSQLAFWINLYNALTVHGIVAWGIQNSVKEVGLSTFFGQTAYRIGADTFSLDDIEHGILRQNHKKHLLARRPFGSKDPRQQWVLTALEPRIHFTLVCGSKSCPPIGTYQEDHLEQQLQLATASFINSENVILNPAKRQLHLSKIFHWYRKDFGTQANLLQLIADYRHDESDKQALLKNSQDWHWHYLPYNWQLNS